MVNVSPIGRSCSKEERNAFEEFDKKAKVREKMVEALKAVFSPTAIVKNAQGRARKLEGLEEGLAVVYGSVDGLIDVPMNGAVYQADVLGGQKTGLFF